MPNLPTARNRPASTPSSPAPRRVIRCASIEVLEFPLAGSMPVPVARVRAASPAGSALAPAGLLAGPMITTGSGIAPPPSVWRFALAD